MPTQLSSFHSFLSRYRVFDVTLYQYIVLLSAYLGWLFDMYDSIIFNYCAPTAIPYLLGIDDLSSKEAQEALAFWTSIFTCVLLIGWATGGIAMGLCTDYFGRSTTMTLTIILYCLATGASALSFHISMLLVCRLIAAIGIGGEFAAAATLVVETMPKNKLLLSSVVLYSAAPMGSLVAYFVNFLLTSVLFQVLPTWLSWRLVFLSGALPVLLCIFIRILVREPEKWVETRHAPKRIKFWHIFSTYKWQTITALVLTISSLITMSGLNSFTPVLASYLTRLQYGTNLPMDEFRSLRDTLLTSGILLFNIGALCGMFALIPIAQHFGRKTVLLFYNVLGTVSIAIAFALPELHPWIRFGMLYFAGFFVFGLLGLFTFYLPELFPMEIRGFGVGFTYNAGRYITAVFPFLFAFLTKSGWNPLLILSCHVVFPLVGFFGAFFAKETKEHSSVWEQTTEPQQKQQEIETVEVQE